jgi:hypothetical protein
MTDDLTKGKVERRERLLHVCKHIVGGNVDADTLAAFRKAVLRCAGNTEEALKNLYESDGEVGVAVRKAFDVLDDAMETCKARDDQNFRSTATGAIYPKGDRWYLDEVADPDDIDEREDGDDDDDDVGKRDAITDHPVVQLTRLLVASGKFGDHAQALDHLLHTASGQGLLQRTLHKTEQTKENNMDSIHAIMKSNGIARTCAAIIQKGATAISEHELVAAATAVAHERHPGLSASAAFAKVYADQGDEGRVLREAVNVAKVSQWLAAGSTVPAKAADRGSNSAYGELMRKAAELRNARPELSEAQAFAKVFSDPANIALAKRERQESAAAR